MGISVGKKRGFPLNKETTMHISLINNKWLELALRWLIGAVFIYASIPKILEPDLFAKIIYGYDLFPKILINIIAITVPYIELVTGLFLVFGIFPK